MLHLSVLPVKMLLLKMLLSRILFLGNLFLRILSLLFAGVRCIGIGSGDFIIHAYYELQSQNLKTREHDKTSKSGFVCDHTRWVSAE